MGIDGENGISATKREVVAMRDSGGSEAEGEG